MSDPIKPAKTASDPDAPAAARDTLNSSIEESALTQAPKAEGAEPADDDLRFLSRAEADDELGRLAGYRILRVLGQGGMGMVLEAEDVRLKRHIAIKVMKPEMAAKESHRRRFLREAQAAARVESDFIIPIYQVGEENGVAFIAMPFLKGEPLDARMKHGRIQVSEMLQIGLQIAEGLAAAHEHGLVHRDIKPGNIWLETVGGGKWAVGSQIKAPMSEVRGRSGIDRLPTFRVKILDFGLARLSQDDVRLTQSGAIIGTPAYMAPEQARGQAVDHRADLFSLGVLLYEMATGKRPFTGNDAMAIISSLALDKPAPPIELDPDLPPIFSQLITKLLEKDPANRVQNANEVVEVLKGLQPKATVVVVAGSHSKTAANPWENIDANNATNTEAPPNLVSRDAESLERSVLPTRTIPGPRDHAGERVPLRKASASRLTWIVSTTFIGIVTLIVIFMNRGKNDPPTDTGNKEGVVNKDVPKKDVSIVAKEIESSPPIANGPEVSFDLGNGIKLEVIKINANGKKFLMGSPKDEPDRAEAKEGFDPEEQHAVTFGHDYYVGKYEVTQEQYETIVESNSSKFKGVRNPVAQVSWNDAQEFLTKLNDRFKNQKVKFRLPSEAEWEYACRAGTETAYSFGKTLTTQEANIGGVGSKPVGSYPDNAFGLFDMHGNVREWCEDFYGPYDKAPNDGTAQTTKQSLDARVVRGGGWFFGARPCRSAFRNSDPPALRLNGLGFRVAVDIADDSPVLTKQVLPVNKNPEVSFELGNGVKLDVIKINAKGKSFLMGSPIDEPGRVKKEEEFDPEEQHEVTFGHDYFMGKYEVTQEQYELVIGMNPSNHQGAKHPVETVSWRDAQEFIKKLNEKLKDRKAKFRLPTEAEWEYACRGGTTTAYHFGKTPNAEKANFKDSKIGSTKPVGSFEPNGFGLYDMHGNVTEWCEDYYGPYNKTMADGSAQLVQQQSLIRVIRGGAWSYNQLMCRSAYRGGNASNNRNENYGFRIAVDIADDSPVLSKK